MEPRILPPVLTILLLVATCFLLARCGAIASPPGHAGSVASPIDCPCTEAGSPAPADLYALGVSITRAYCTAAGACCAAPFDVDRCVATNTYPTQIFAHPTFDLPEAERGLEAGTITAGDAAACFADLDAMPCGTIGSDFFLAMTRDCRNVFQGTLPPGAPCSNAFECAGEAWCSQPTASADRRCTSLLQAHADGSSGVGAWCGNDESNFGCQVHGASSSGLWCDTDQSETCLPTLPLDAADPYPGACTSGLATGGGCAASAPWVSAGSFFCRFYLPSDGGDAGAD